MPATESPALSAAEVAQFHRDGYLVMRGFYAAKETDAIRDAFTELAKDGPVPGLSEAKREYASDDPLAHYPRMMHPHRHSELEVGPLATRYMLHPRVGAVMRALFGEEPIAAQSMFYFKPPGARGQDLHQDNFYLRVKPGTCIAAWLAVDDADEENGGMVVVPGSNRCEVFCPQAADSAIFFTNDHVEIPPGLREQPLSLKAGDMLFFNGSVIHGSYPNRSRDRFRRAFICHYVPRGSEEVAHWYRPLLTFDGAEVAMPAATGGGPCGTVGDRMKGPH